jgi:hypothetical protein
MSDLRELPKAYDASAVEDAIYAAWEAPALLIPINCRIATKKGSRSAS